MRSLAVAPVLVASALALPELFLEKRDLNTNGATKDFARSVSSVEKRAGTLETTVFDVISWTTGGAYYVNVSIGTPPQLQTVVLDTGSSTLYFDSYDAPACKTDGAYACMGGTFNYHDSSTYNLVAASPAFNVSYGDNSTAYGPFATDVFGIGDLSISNVQFGLAEVVNKTTGFAIGILGVGYSFLDIEGPQSYPFPNLPEILKDVGAISSRLYSLFLNDEANISGSILFGGIDTSRYSGELVTLDFLPQYAGPNPTADELDIYQFVTTVTAANVTVNGTTSTLFSGGANNYSAYGSTNSLPVLLDSGSTAWSIDPNIWEMYFAKPFNSFIDTETGLTPCSRASSTDSVSLEFGGKVQITIPAREYIVPYINSTTKQPIYSQDGSEQLCVFLITPGSNLGEGFQPLGDAILRSMYLVYDLDNAQVSIAQANTNGGSPNVVAVSAGPSGVANAVSGVVTAPLQTGVVIDPAVSTADLAAFSVSTASTTLGTATGWAAVPTTARGPSEIVATPTGSSGSGGSGSSPSGTHKSAAAAVIAPNAGSAGVWVTAIAVSFAALGACLI